MAHMPHMSYRAALAHAVDDLAHWGAKAPHADRVRDGLLGTINRYRERLGLGPLVTVTDVATHSAVERVFEQQRKYTADDIYRHIMVLVHGMRTEMLSDNVGTIYLAPYDFDLVVSATKILTNPEQCDPNDPANYRYEDPATCARHGTFMGRRIESDPDVPEGSIWVGRKLILSEVVNARAEQHA